MNTPSLKISQAFKSLALAAALCAGSGLSHAQGAAAGASSPAKKELIAKLLVVQQPGIDTLSRTILQQPLGGLMQGAAGALQQMPAEKREATAKAVEAEVKKFVEENGSMLRERATKLAPSTIGVLLDERFSEDELKQLLAWFESPVNKKFNQISGELQKSLTEKLLADTGSTLDTRFKALQQTVAKQLGVSTKPASAPAPASKK